MLDFLQNHPLLPALLTSISLGVACAVLSVFVVLRRWAFIGEGIAHSTFGGAGLAWILVLIFPALGTPTHLAPLVLTTILIFSMSTAWAIAYFSGSRRINSDAVIGIFLVASLGFGFMAERIYEQAKNQIPWGYDSVFLGNVMGISPEWAIASTLICLAVVGVIWAFGKEIVAYSFDPLAARVAGAPARFIHYMLVSLVAFTIIMGVRVAGSLLVTALLVLPGVCALLVSQRMSRVIFLSIITAVTGAAGGTIIHYNLKYIPTGPAIVLVLFALFLITYTFSRLLLPMLNRAAPAPDAA